MYEKITMIVLIMMIVLTMMMMLIPKVRWLKENWHLVAAAKTLAPVAASFYELMTAPTTKVKQRQRHIQNTQAKTMTKTKYTGKDNDKGRGKCTAKTLAPVAASFYELMSASTTKVKHRQRQRQ